MIEMNDGYDALYLPEKNRKNVQNGIYNLCWNDTYYINIMYIVL